MAGSSLGRTSFPTRLGPSGSATRSRSSKPEPRTSYSKRLRLEAEQVVEHVAQEVRLLAAGRRGARHEVEDLAVLHPIIGDALDLAGLGGEIDGEDVLILHLHGHEGKRAVHLLADIVPGVAADRRRRG